MNWSIVGWMAIGLSALMLVIFSLLRKKPDTYSLRRSVSAEGLMKAQTNAIERGQPRLIAIGDQYWSRTYPGLGLHALTALPILADAENIVDGELSVSGGDGSLVVLARQIVQSDYVNGFSMELSNPRVRTILPGPTQLSYSVGLLYELGLQKYGSIALFGNYGPEAILWTEAVQSRGGYVFAAAGSIISQAVLLFNVRDLVIGESVFSTAGLLTSNEVDQTRWMTEDILRVLLILGLIAGVIMRLVGVL
ncbi:MAG: DUF6754 domain-containing protein [Chloroflexota bacterium]|nr:DUF6754 domain-containing protein [Chloroflexota bacterium]